MIIHDIYNTITSTIEFLHKSISSWRARKQIGLGATLVDLVFIEGSKEDKAME
jgi:hypothetical protein